MAESQTQNSVEKIKELIKELGYGDIEFHDDTTFSIGIDLSEDIEECEREFMNSCIEMCMKEGETKENCEQYCMEEDPECLDENAGKAYELERQFYDELRKEGIDVEVEECGWDEYVYWCRYKLIV